MSILYKHITFVVAYFAPLANDHKTKRHNTFSKTKRDIKINTIFLT